MMLLKKIGLFILLYLLFFYVYTWRNLLIIKENNYPVRNLYVDYIKTGDIFLLGNKKYQRILGDLIFMVNFVHPSIAVWEDSNLFILEFSIYPDKEGFMKIPFSEWLSYNKNKIMLHSQLEISEEKEEDRESISEKILSFYESHKEKINSMNKKFDITWLRFPLRIKRDLTINSITCTEVLASIIYSSGLSEKDKGISYYHQSDFISLQGFKLKNRFSYHKNYLCKFQHLMKKYI